MQNSNIKLYVNVIKILICQIWETYKYINLICIDLSLKRNRLSKPFIIFIVKQTKVIEYHPDPSTTAFEWPCSNNFSINI